MSLSLYWLIQCSRHYRREILLTVCTVWTRVNCKNWLCRDENELWHKPAGRKRRPGRNHILCPKVQPLIKFFLVYCLLIHLCHVAPQIYRWRAEFLSSLWASDICHKDSESFSFVQLRDLARQSLLCCVVFRGQAGRRGTCSCRCSVPALHHNKGNLNAVLFYGHCCKILLGHCGPYETIWELSNSQRGVTSLDWEGWFIYVGLLSRAVVPQRSVDFVLRSKPVLFDCR